jgi:hypothetical protein
VRRLPPTAFGALVVATIAAFFIVQHLKVTLPLINGDPLPLPAAFNPLDGRAGPGEPAVCRHRQPSGRVVEVDYRRTYVTFYLQHQAAHVEVQIVTPSGRVVRTLVRDYYMPLDRRNPPGAFAWNGRDGDGRIAAPGVYYYRVTLRELHRDVLIDRPITIITAAPRPSIDAVRPSTAVPGAPVRIAYSGARGDRDELLLYRVGRDGRPILVKSFTIPSQRTRAVWNGLIGGAPAPAGTYLLALRAIDPACNVASYPASLPPRLGGAPALRVR